MKKLQVGDKAPLFVGKSQAGEMVSLEDFYGQKVVLYFYPKDNTPGCTRQACNIRDHYPTLEKEGYTVIGISRDSAKTHAGFVAKHQLPFILIADEDRAIRKKYNIGVPLLGFPARTTFIMDEKGFITKIIDKVKTLAHVEQILHTPNKDN